MSSFGPQIQISFAFLVANVLVLLAILALTRRAGSKPLQAAEPPREGPKLQSLNAVHILDWEFEYARTTASEAMQDRHIMVNFYLLAAGVVLSGAVAVLGQDTPLPSAAGTALLWLLCAIGWLYFLKIIRLRQAWHDSARTMNRIKDFCILHAQDVQPDVLRTAFRWQAHTLPPPDKPWTLFFYSAVLIALLDSFAYVAGAAVMDLESVLQSPLAIGGVLAVFGVAFFAFHIWLYFQILRPGPDSQDGPDDLVEVR